MLDMGTDEGRVQSLLLETWLPVAAIAKFAAIPTKTALAILQRKTHDWALELVRVRIDGHNCVHCVRRRNPRKVQVMGVWMPVVASSEDETE